MSRSIRRFFKRVRPVVITGLLAALAPLPAVAVDLEPYLFTAYRDGDLSFGTGVACIEIVGQDCPTVASTEDGDEDAWGLGAALRLNGPWWLDLRWSRQETEARFFDPPRGPVPFPPAALDLTQLHAGVLYRFGDGRWSPFVTAFAGVSRIESEATTPERSEIDLDRASGGVGGGLLVDLGRRLGVRLEVRGTRTDLPGDFDDDLEQLEASAGVRLRF